MKGFEATLLKWSSFLLIFHSVFILLRWPHAKPFPTFLWSPRIMTLSKISPMLYFPLKISLILVPWPLLVTHDFFHYVLRFHSYPDLRYLYLSVQIYDKYSKRFHSLLHNLINCFVSKKGRNSSKSTVEWLNIFINWRNWLKFLWNWRKCSTMDKIRE